MEYNHRFQNMCMEKDTNPVSVSWKNTLEGPSCALKIQMWLWDPALITGVFKVQNSPFNGTFPYL